MSGEPDIDTGNGTIEAIVSGLIDAFGALEERVSSLEGGEAVADMSFEDWLDRITAEYGLENTFRGYAPVPGLKNELSALHAAWLSAHNEDLEPKVGFQAVSWHDSLARVVERADWWRARDKRRTASN